jgi:hypothetical protein
MKSDRKNNLAEGTSVNQVLRSIHGSASKASSTKEGQSVGVSRNSKAAFEKSPG